MKVLFIGGTGVISSACAELALARGIELYLLNRGESARPAPAGARILRADIRDRAQTQAALAGLTFDAVVDWVAFTPEHVAIDIELFRGRTGQYVFISSATVYEKPPRCLPITESTPRSNPFWPYAAHKIACEERLEQAYRSEQFPVTIVRPSHTYDRTKLPTLGYYTAIARLRAGKPAVVHGDGTSLWVLTHHRDFAVGFVGLLGNPRAVGEAFHITSDELLTWNQIYTLLARAAGAEPKLVHVPSEIIARFDPELGAGLLGDKAHSVIFDNSKIRRFAPDFAPAIPFATGAAEIMAWYDADPARQVVDPALDRLMDALVTHMQAVTPR
jgi:nucleoside-diphosphate-sugar epimerase